MSIKYIVVDEFDSGTLFAIGIVDSFEKAVAIMMSCVWAIQESYKDEGDIFQISQLETRIDGGGYVLDITYKAKSWDKPESGRYHILTVENESKKEEKDGST